MKHFLILLCVLLVSCTKPNKKPAQPPKSERRSLVFGRIQFASPVTYVAVQNNLRVYIFQGGERVHVWPDGFFFAENVLRGTYQIDRVYADKFGYLLPRNVFQEVPVVQASVQYLGSYSVKALRKEDPMHGVLASKLPSEELMLLERIRKEVLETPWEKMIDERIAELTPTAPASKPASAPASTNAQE